MDELRPWNAQDYYTYKLYAEHCENEVPLKALGHKHILKTSAIVQARDTGRSIPFLKSVGRASGWMDFSEDSED